MNRAPDRTGTRTPATGDPASTPGLCPLRGQPAEAGWEPQIDHHPETQNEPHRFVLGERMEQRLYLLRETLIQAKYTRNRRELLQQANLSLEVLRFQMRLAKDLQCLRGNSYVFASKAIQEIGQQVGGWLRQASKDLS
jgi:hypothetical protein